MKIPIDYLLYATGFGAFVGRIIYNTFRIRKMMKDEMIKGNVKPLSYSWKMKIYPVLKEAWQERKLIKNELIKSFRKSKNE